MRKSGFLQKMQVQNEIERKRASIHTLQQCKDMMLIAAHVEFGFGPERLKRLSDAFDKTFVEYAVTCLTDEKEIWYTKEKVDQMLKEACGQYFVPFNERYGVKRDG